MRDKFDLDRRRLLRGLAATPLLPLLGGNLMGCSDGSDNTLATVAANFEHGVASGDPLADRVILWTRLTPVEEGRVAVAWELARDADFRDVVASGSGTTGAEVDYTVKVDATGLDSGAGYYYRFRSGDAVSPTGHTRTLPVGATPAVAFAVVSCSNYPAGFFNVYREVAAQEVDAVLHLGDYIYEYPLGDGDGVRTAAGNVVPPAGETLSLQDYRRRYALYRTDADLQAVHAAHPFIVVWDDHEVANNTWREGAQNHDPQTEGDFAARRMAAIQAWYEWQPVRPPASEREIIYRNFRFGDLVDLLMLDTRQIGRDLQLSYSDFATGGIIDVEGVRAAYNDPARSLLGDDQRAWLREQLSASSARWQVLGQQVLLGRYTLPSPIMEALDPSLGTEGALEKGTAAVLQAVEARNKLPAERTAQEQALLDSAIPYNLDAWDGYARERDNLLEHAVATGSHVVALAGDTHNAWSTQLTTADGRVAGVEFGCTSVSSPGLDGILGPGPAALFNPLVSVLMDDLRAANLTARGYLYLRLTADELQAEHRFITGVDSPQYAVDETLTLTASVRRDDLLLS